MHCPIRQGRARNSQRIFVRGPVLGEALMCAHASTPYSNGAAELRQVLVWFMAAAFGVVDEEEPADPPVDYPSVLTGWPVARSASRKTVAASVPMAAAIVANSIPGPPCSRIGSSTNGSAAAVSLESE